MVIVCDNCGRENEDEFAFCLGCGSEITASEDEAEDEPQMVDCPHCEQRVPGGFKFCGQCGGSLEEAATDTAPAPGGPTAATEQSEKPSPTADTGQRLGELTVIRPDGTEGAVIPLTDDGVMLGRHSEFDVLADDPYLSPQHAEIRRENGGFVISDLDSLNGVYWRIRDDVELEHGDLLRVGQELLRFQSFDRVEPVDADADDGALHGSPDPGIWGRLLLIGGPDAVTRAFAISGQEATLGREMGSILFRDDGFVSGKHAKIYRENGTVYFRDLGSSNGSYIRIHSDRRIGNGDLVLMGQQLLRVTLD